MVLSIDVPAWLAALAIIAVLVGYCFHLKAKRIRYEQKSSRQT